jgi:23S rRNA (adenine2503-C2)-methyltransferase
MEVLSSKLDRSVNFVENQLVGFIESRYVRRHNNYFIAYLSTQSGCNRGCKFCHLTATKQLQFKDCTVSSILSQARTIFDHYDIDHYDNDSPADYMHFNFMSRGEPLANKVIEERWDHLLYSLGEYAIERHLIPKFNVSTIMPITMKRSLTKTFPIITPTIYYSMYSTNQAWRDAWMPAAMTVDDAILQLKEYQKSSKKIVKVHGAFISGENDSTDDIDSMIKALDKLQTEFNIVRYNPYSSEQGTESLYIDEIAATLSKYMPTKVIPRVGFDVKASCGMFVE